MLFEQGLPVSRALNDNTYVAKHLINLAQVEIQLGMVETARPHLAEGLRRGQEINLGEDCQIALCETVLYCRLAAERAPTAEIARRLDAAGARLLGASEDFPEGMNPYEQAPAFCAALGEEAFRAAVAEGHALRFEQAIACARGVLEE